MLSRGSQSQKDRFSKVSVEIELTYESINQNNGCLGLGEGKNWNKTAFKGDENVLHGGRGAVYLGVYIF